MLYTILLGTLAALPGQSFPDMARRAVEFAETNQRDKAMKLLGQMEQQAAREIDIAKRTRYQWFVQWKRGYCEYALGDLLTAQETLEKARQKAPKDLVAYLLRDLADVYLAQGKVIESEPCIDDYIEASAEAELIRAALQFVDLPDYRGLPKIDESELIRVQICKVQCLIGRNEFQAGHTNMLEIEARIETFRQQNRGALNDSWASRYAECQMLLAALACRNNDMIGAINRLKQARNILKDRDQLPLCMILNFSCHLQLAQYYWSLTRFDEAKEQLDAAQKRLPKLRQRDQVDWDNARACLWIESSQFALRLNPADRRCLDDLTSAEKMLQKVATAYHKLDGGKAGLTANTHFLFAQVHELRGLYLETLGGAPKAKQEFEQGKRHCDIALKVNQEFLPANSPAELELRHKRAWIFFRLGNLPAARQEATAALEAFTDVNGKDHIDSGRFHHLLLVIEDRAGNVKQAMKHADDHRRLVAHGLLAYLGALSAPEQVHFFHKWDDPGLHASLMLAVRHAASNSALADASAEWLINGKAMIAETMAQIRAEVRKSQDYQKFQSAIERQAFYLYGPPNDGRASLLLEEEALKRKLTEAWPVRQVRRWCSLAEIRKQLTAKDAYVGIFCLRPDGKRERTYHAWIVTSEGPARIVKLGDADSIEKLVKQLIDHQERFLTIRLAGERKAESDLRTACLQPLSRLILDPILEHADGRKRWIISPDGLLWNVPYAALLLPKTDKYALEELTVRYVISGRELAEAPVQKPADGEFLIMGDPDLQWQPAGLKGHLRDRKDRLFFGDLPLSQLECRALAGQLAKTTQRKPRLLLRDSATKASLAQLNKAPRLLYLSTHSASHLGGEGNLRVDDPMLHCAIAFAGWNFLPEGKTSNALPGLMTAAEVLGLDLQGTELVVLASCQSGTGELAYGQSPADLRHAFHLAGARAVVSTLWPVHDESTAELMIPFMTAYAEKPGRDEADALRAAQRELMISLREHRGHTHPFFWAAFTVSGRRPSP